MVREDYGFVLFLLSRQCFESLYQRFLSVMLSLSYHLNVIGHIQIEEKLVLPTTYELLGME